MRQYNSESIKENHDNVTAREISHQNTFLFVF